MPNHQNENFQKSEPKKKEKGKKRPSIPTLQTQGQTLTTTTRIDADGPQLATDSPATGDATCGGADLRADSGAHEQRCRWAPADHKPTDTPSSNDDDPDPDDSDVNVESPPDASWADDDPCKPASPAPGGSTTTWGARLGFAAPASALCA